MPLALGDLQVRERRFIPKTEHLPRQARDKHRESTQNKRCVCVRVRVRVCFLAGRIQSTRAQQAAAARMGLSSHLRLVRKR